MIQAPAKANKMTKDRTLGEVTPLKIILEKEK